MAYSRTRLHNPVVRPPKGPRTPTHIPASLLPLTSNRNAHIVRLYSILVHLVSLPPSPHTSVRLVRAWRALAACKEVHLGVLWRLGAAVLEQTRDGSEHQGEDDEDDEAAQERAERRAEWLKSCQEGLLDRVDKFAEYALALVAAGRIDFALDELDGCVLPLFFPLFTPAISDTSRQRCSYLDNQPYHDSISLNTLYGQLALLSVQPAPLPALNAAAPSSSSSSSSASDSSDDELYPAARNGRSVSAGGSKRAAKRARVTARANRQSALFPRLTPFHCADPPHVCTTQTRVATPRTTTARCCTPSPRNSRRCLRGRPNVFGGQLTSRNAPSKRRQDIVLLRVKQHAGSLW